jgi:hypothetical protein
VGILEYRLQSILEILLILLIPTNSHESYRVLRIFMLLFISRGLMSHVIDDL